MTRAEQHQVNAAGRAFARGIVSAIRRRQGSVLEGRRPCARNRALCLLRQPPKCAPAVARRAVPPTIRQTIRQPARRDVSTREEYQAAMQAFNEGAHD